MTEQQRIRDYAHGFNDASMGRAPRAGAVLSYEIGYRDGQH